MKTKDVLLVRHSSAFLIWITPPSTLFTLSHDDQSPVSFICDALLKAPPRQTTDLLHPVNSSKCSVLTHTQNHPFQWPYQRTLSHLNTWLNIPKILLHTSTCMIINYLRFLNFGIYFYRYNIFLLVIYFLQRLIWIEIDKSIFRKCNA